MHTNQITSSLKLGSLCCNVNMAVLIPQQRRHSNVWRRCVSGSRKHPSSDQMRRVRPVPSQRVTTLVISLPPRMIQLVSRMTRVWKILFKNQGMRWHRTRPSLRLRIPDHHPWPRVETCLRAAIAKDIFLFPFGIVYFAKVSPWDQIAPNRLNTDTPSALSDNLFICSICDMEGVPDLSHSSEKHTEEHHLIRCLAPEEAKKAPSTEQRLASLEKRLDNMQTRFDDFSNKIEQLLHKLASNIG